MSYESFRKSWGPTWLKRTGGAAWQGAHGRYGDKLVEQLKQAVKSQFPGEGPDDSLAYLGSEIGIPRSPVDSDEEYAVKLRKAWDVWPFAGTPLGILLAMEAAGYAAGKAIVVQQEAHAFGLNTDTTLNPEDRLVTYDLMGGRWTFGGGYTLWNRFGILFPDPADLPTGWAAGAVAPPTLVSTPTLDEVNGLIRLVNKWKRSGAIFMWIKVVTSGHVWGWPPTLAWGTSGLTWGGSSVTWGPSEY